MCRTVFCHDVKSLFLIFSVFVFQADEGFLFCIVGMGVCLLSAYINTFLAAVCRADALAATAEIAPVVEEMMKLLPLVFYLLVFEPEGN